MLRVLSSDFHNTPIESREKIFVGKENYASVHQHMLEKCELKDLVLLSTCNRSEIYFISEEANTPSSEKITKTFFEALGVPFDPSVCFREYREDDALLHLLRVTCSLESLVIGESQILGQVKSAFEVAQSICPIRGAMRIFFEKAFSTAKRVKNETAIHKHTISISSAAVSLAGKVFGDLSEKTVMIVGSGEMAELALKSLVSAGDNMNLMVVNRTFKNAIELAEKYRGSAIPFDCLKQNLYFADIVISCTGSKEYIFDEKTVSKAMVQKRYEPVFFIDIALPRDVDPAVHELENVYLYDIDDLQEVSEQNFKERKQEAGQALKIVEEETKTIRRLVELRKNGRWIDAFRKNFNQMLEDRLLAEAKAKKKFSEDEIEILHREMRKFGNKFLHHPTELLRNKIEEGDTQFLNHFCEIFNLNIEETNSENQSAKIIRLNAR